MDCLADTHASVWYLFAAPELSAAAKNFMDAATASGGFVFVPTISIIEIIYLTEKGKLLPQTLARLIQAVNLPSRGFRLLNWTPALLKLYRKFRAQLFPICPTGLSPRPRCI